MGHRDIWGKDKSKWKKQCPCFDAEAEYAYLDLMNKPGAAPNEYVKPKKENFLAKIWPWKKTKNS